MTTFSERYGFAMAKELQTDTVDDSLRNRIWNYFFNEELNEGPANPLAFDFASSSYGIAEELLDKMGYRYEDPDRGMGHLRNVEKLKSYLESCDWNNVYDFIERYLSLVDEGEGIRIAGELNELLEEEKSAYRIVTERENGCSAFQVAPITNQLELAELEQSLSVGIDAVDASMSKALSLYSDRCHPDYANSIKESICAVESMFAKMTGKKRTLSENLKFMKNADPNIHPAFLEAIGKLYAFTCDAGGIRHGGNDVSLQATETNARFMLVVCSAFINYLKTFSNI